jgi:hypothetical protein
MFFDIPKATKKFTKIKGIPKTTIIFLLNWTINIAKTMKNKIAVKLFVTRYPIIFKADNTHTIFKTVLFVSKLCKALGIFIYIYNVLKKN